MKKILAMLLTVLMLSTMCTAFALDVILIAPNPNAAPKTVSLQVEGVAGSIYAGEVVWSWLRRSFQWSANTFPTPSKCGLYQEYASTRNGVWLQCCRQAEVCLSRFVARRSTYIHYQGECVALYRLSGLS